MKKYIHARLSKDERAMLDRLKHATGHSESALVRRGLRLVSREAEAGRSALALAGRSVGKVQNGPRDLSTNKKHLAGFGE